MVLVDRAADQLAALGAALGDRAVPLAVDLTDPADGSQMLPRILDATGRLDVFHANAGAYVGGDIVDQDPTPGTGCWP